MADAILDRLTATSIFDLRGVVAVVTGGGTVRSPAYPRFPSLPSVLLSTLYVHIGYRTDDQHDAHGERRESVYHWAEAG